MILAALGAFAVLLVALGLSMWHDARKRAAMLAAMSEEDREAFLDKERRDLEAGEQAAEERRTAAEKQKSEWESRKDARKAADAIRLVEVAAAEGRTAARVWVDRRHVDAVRRWGERNGYTVLVVKEWGRKGDTQLSISWTQRKT